MIVWIFTKKVKIKMVYGFIVSNGFVFVWLIELIVFDLFGIGFGIGLFECLIGIGFGIDLFGCLIGINECLTYIN